MKRSSIKFFIACSKKNYHSLKNNFTDYKNYFGDISEVFYSPYFHLAILISFVITTFSENTAEWSNYALGGLPSILGFSIGGYAIIITFGDDKFREFLVKKEPNSQKPLLLIINGTFIHFILVQAIALLCALIIKTLCISNFIINFIFVIPFIYSILLSVATAFTIKTISSWYVKFINSRKQNVNGNAPKK